MNGGITLDMVTNALHIATGDDYAHVITIIMQREEVDFRARMGNSAMVNGTGDSIADAFVDLISNARQTVGA